jgi:hypothetical protein
MLGEKEEDRWSKANGTMNFIAKLPLKLLLIFAGLILFLVGLIVFGNEAVRFLKYYFGFR